MPAQPKGHGRTYTLDIQLTSVKSQVHDDAIRDAEVYFVFAKIEKTSHLQVMEKKAGFFNFGTVSQRAHFGQRLLVELSCLRLPPVPSARKSDFTCTRISRPWRKGLC